MTAQNDQILLMLGEINGKLDSAIARMDRNDQAMSTLEGRVTVLERGRAWIVGAGATLSFFITIFVGSLTDIFTRS